MILFVLGLLAAMQELPTFDVVVDNKPHSLIWTVDDHPAPETPEFLDLFKQKGIKATFFLVGYPIQAYNRNPSYSPAKRRFQVAQRIFQEGHIIGNHSLTHLDLCAPGFPKWRVDYEIDLTQKLLSQLTGGVAPKVWRPPHGKICKWIYRKVNKEKLTSYLWDIGDWKTAALRMMYLLRRRVAQGETQTILLFHRDTTKLKKFMSLLGI